MGKPGKHSGKEKKSHLQDQRPAEKKPAESKYLAAPGGTEHYANFIDAIRAGKMKLFIVIL